jgi:hypothetical protein
MEENVGTTLDQQGAELQVRRCCSLNPDDDQGSGQPDPDPVKPSLPFELQ